MVASTEIYNLEGNQILVEGVTLAHNAMTNVNFTAALRPTITAGAGVPTFSAPKGSIYTDITAAGASLRLYVNNNGTTGWAAVTSA